MAAAIAHINQTIVFSWTGCTIDAETRFHALPPPWSDVFRVSTSLNEAKDRFILRWECPQYDDFATLRFKKKTVVSRFVYDASAGKTVQRQTVFEHVWDESSEPFDVLSLHESTLVVNCDISVTIHEFDIDPHPLALRAVRSWIAGAQQPHFGDVVFRFPRTKQQCRAESAILTQVPYFKDLLQDSGFSESLTTSGTTQETADVDVDLEYDDSDDELDEEADVGDEDEMKSDGITSKEKVAQRAIGNGADQGPAENEEADDSAAGGNEGGVVRRAQGQQVAKRSQVPTNSNSRPCKVVTITQTAFLTYRALLVYIATGVVKFATLKSKKRLEADVDKKSSGKAHAAAGCFPVVSPKSLYRLAHLLDISAVQQLCLAEMQRQRSHEVVATELFTRESAHYSDVKDVWMEWAVANWAEVKQTEGLKAAKAAMKASELEHGQAVFMELIEKAAGV